MQINGRVDKDSNGVVLKRSLMLNIHNIIICNMFHLWERDEGLFRLECV